MTTAIVAGRVLRQKVRLERPLASGHDCELWVGRHLALQSEVLVKLLRVSADADDRCEREASALAQIRGPHVVQIFDSGTLPEGISYLVTELLEGETLTSLLQKRRRLGIGETITVVQHVSRALTRAHAAGIMHGDLTPSSVFVSDCEGDLFVRVLDFGASRAAASRTFDHRGDLRALAVIARTCLGGARLAPALTDWFERALGDAGRSFGSAKELAESFALAAKSAPVTEDFESRAEALEQNGHFEELVELCLGELEKLEQPRARAEMLMRIARVLEHELGDAGQAFDAVWAAFIEDVRDDSMLRELERLAARTGRYPELVANTQALLASQPDRADLLAAHLGKWQTVAQPSTDLEMAGARLWCELEQTDDPLRRADLRSQIGRLLEQLERLDEAGAQYHRALLDDPSNLIALSGLARIHRARESWRDLSLVLDRISESKATHRERFDALFELSRILAERLCDPAEAARRLEVALELEPSSSVAFKALENCYRSLGRAIDLVLTCERHIQIAKEASEKLALWTEVLRVYTEEVRDLERAAEAHTRILELDPTRLSSQIALGEYAVSRADHATAKRHLRRALEIAPNQPDALAALRKMAVVEGDWEEVIACLAREQVHERDPRARARALAELGTLHSEKLGQPALAIAAWQEALRCDRECEAAALPLVHVLIGAGQWAEALPLCRTLVRLGEKRDRIEGAGRYKLLARVLGAFGDHRAALDAHERARSLAPGDLEALYGAADAALAAGLAERALSIQSELILLLEPDQHAERSRAFLDRARARLLLRDERRAREDLDRAFSDAPADRKLFDELAEAFQAVGAVERVVDCKRRVLELAPAGEALSISVEIAQLWYAVGAIGRTIDALEQAHALAPSERRILLWLLEIFRATEDWRKLLLTLEKLAELAPETELKSRYCVTMAELSRDQLSDPDRAVEFFEQALDRNPHARSAFEALCNLHLSRADWSSLERSYRRMLHRMRPFDEPDFKRALWSDLGVLYRDRLDRGQDAARAFAAALEVDPNRRTQRVMLADAYERSGHLDQAIAEQRRLIGRDPARVDAYRALYRLTLAKREYDEAWCVCAALAFINKTDAAQAKFYERYRPKGVLEIEGSLNGQLWRRHLLHPDSNDGTANVLEAVAGAALRAKVFELRASGQMPVLDPRLREDPAQPRVPLARAFGLAARALGIAAPELYVRYDLPGSIVSVRSLPAASLAGRTALTELSAPERMFLCGKHLAGARGARALRSLFPTATELTILFCAAVSVVARVPMPREIEPLATVTARELVKYLGPIELEALRIAAERFIAHGGQANLRRFTQAAELSACRAGLLVSGDLDAARAIVVSEPELPGDPQPREKIADLLAFSVSEDYAKLRRALKVSGNPSRRELPPVPRAVAV